MDQSTWQDEFSYGIILIKIIDQSTMANVQQEYHDNLRNAKKHMTITTKLLLKFSIKYKLVKSLTKSFKVFQNKNGQLYTLSKYILHEI
jgi:hypothetical protein